MSGYRVPDYKRAFRRPIRSLLYSAGIHAAPKANTADVLALIHSLSPQDCGMDLIRIGPKKDGGYLVPDDLQGIEYCFSPGVGDSCAFEEDLANRGIRSFLADFSVDSPPSMRDEYRFDRKFLGALDSDQYISLASWKEKYLPQYTADLLMQMDIEGYEYEVILSTPESLLDQFRILVVEFHELDHMFDAFALKLYRSCFTKLLRLFHVAHIHPVNCAEVVSRGPIVIPRQMEFTFLNKRRVSHVKPARKFPHPADADCCVGGSVELPSCWYRHEV